MACASLISSERQRKVQENNLDVPVINVKAQGIRVWSFYTSLFAVAIVKSPQLGSGKKPFFYLAYTFEGRNFKQCDTISGNDLPVTLYQSKGNCGRKN